MIRIPIWLVLANLSTFLVACGSHGPQNLGPDDPEGSGSHKAVHGGVLNEVEAEAASFEILIEGNTLRCWIVNVDYPNRSVRIPAKEIHFDIVLLDGAKKNLTLVPKPIELAEERIGDCSYFEAEAAWLSEKVSFEASARTEIKGAVRNVVIHHPQGYTP